MSCKSEPIRQYKLTTVTYGTASAPFLAVRTLMEIGNRCKDQKIAKRIKEDFYMDDDTEKECMAVQKKKYRSSWRLTDSI